MMRGSDEGNGGLFSYVDLEQRVRADHPPRVIREIANASLKARSEVDGTLIEAWASSKSFKPRDGSGEPPDPGRNGERDFHGERRTNDTHASTTVPNARLSGTGRGKEARLSFMGHALMENRNGPIIGAVAPRASGHAERLAAIALIAPHAERPHPITLGGDKNDDTNDFVTEPRERAVTPYVARNDTNRRSAIDGRSRCYSPSRDAAKHVTRRRRNHEITARVIKPKIRTAFQQPAKARA